jgi:hypothetical protein
MFALFIFLPSFLPIHISSTHLDYVCFPLACACTYLSNFAVSCLPLRCISVGTLFCIPLDLYCLSDYMLFTCRIHFQPGLLYVFYHCCSFSLVMPRAAYLFFLILRTFGDVCTHFWLGHVRPSTFCTSFIMFIHVPTFIA